MFGDDVKVFGDDVKGFGGHVKVFAGVVKVFEGNFVEADDKSAHGNRQDRCT